MSCGKTILQPDEADISKILAANAHLGSTNVNYQMQQYIFKRRADGRYLFGNIVPFLDIIWVLFEFVQ